MIKSLLSSFGSIFTAFVASSCCIGPLAFTLLGVGGIGFGASLEQYRFLLILLTSILIGFSYYLVNRPLEKLCIDGKCDIKEATKMRKINRIILGISAGIAVILMVVPQFLLLFI